MPTTLTNGIQLPDKGSVDWYSSMQSNYNLIDTHLGDTDVHVTAEDKANWNSKQGSLSQDQLDAIAQVATNTDDIATLQSDKADASHTHSSSDITDIDDYATKDYVDNSISGLVDNAPDALNTLNELSAALNDDSNFASTVTTALAAKADSADLATVATSGSYNDLSNKPTINDSTITIQKNGSTVDTFTTNGSAKTIDITVPTKTSDLTNDSNFVDTSNSAVSSGITSAKVTDYDTHIADTDIHVTTADKNRWNNQTYVFRYSSTALTASSTNSNALLDNTDNLKVGDKVIDSSGVLFSITAIDTQNSTFTIGTALIDLAQDSDVVHKSGNEYITDTKTFGKGTLIVDNSVGSNVHGEIKLSGSRSGYIVADSASDGVFDNTSCGISILLQDKGKPLHVGSYNVDSNGRVFADNTNKNPVLTVRGGSIRSSTLIPENDTSDNAFIISSELTYANSNPSKILNVVFRQNDDADTTSAVYSNTNNVTSLGISTRRWSKIYGTEYYYGSNNVEFSTKFVTTDTAQTISGVKNFSDNISAKKIISNVAQLQINAKSSADTVAVIAGANASEGGGLWIYGKDSGVGSDCRLQIYNTSKSRYERVDLVNSQFLPAPSSELDCGSDSYKWKSFNGLEPSSLGMPDLSNGIDISSYITVNGGNKESLYTPPSNGWISVALSRSSGGSVAVLLKQGNIASSGHRVEQENGTGSCNAMLPVKGGVQVSINSALANGVVSAYFYPCLGNI